MLGISNVAMEDRLELLFDVAAKICAGKRSSRHVGIQGTEYHEVRLSWCALPGEEESLLMVYSRIVVDGLVVQASC